MILVTGFEAFDGRTKNGSATSASYLNGFDTGNGIVNSQIIPVVWSTVREFCETVIARSDATMIVGIGEADCPRPRFEHQAKLHASGIDNLGCEPPSLTTPDDSQPRTVQCETLACDRDWFADLSCAMDDSWDAGAYLCNWYLLHALRHAQVAAGFVHVPLQRSLSDEDYLDQHAPLLERFIQKNAQRVQASS